MSDRLSDLKRQREIAQQQLAWFDREIARESGVAATPAPLVSPPSAISRSVLPPATAAIPDADQLIAQFRDQGRPIKDEVRRGCLLYFFSAFGLLILGLVTWYLLRRN